MQSIDDEEASPSAYAEPGVGATLCDALCFRPAKDNTLLFRPRNGQAGFESNPVSGVYQQPAFVEMLCKVVPICSIINLVVEFFILGADCVHLGLTVPHPNLCAKHTIFGDLFITAMIISFISTVGIHIEVQKGVLGYPWNYMCKRQKCEPWIVPCADDIVDTGCFWKLWPVGTKKPVLRRIWPRAFVMMFSLGLCWAILFCGVLAVFRSVDLWSGQVNRLQMTLLKSTFCGLTGGLSVIINFPMSVRQASVDQMLGTGDGESTATASPEGQASIQEDSLDPWSAGERRASSPRANSDGSLPAADPYAAHRSGGGAVDDAGEQFIRPRMLTAGDALTDDAKPGRGAE